MLSYHDALDYIFSFTNFEVTPAGDYTSKTFDLQRIDHLLKALGNPHHHFRSVHVAGTKGKGSTAAMIESVLRAAGYHTGFYTSPHLHTFRERIRIGGSLITREEMAAGVERMMLHAAEIPGLTTFELMTGLAFDSFRRHQVEIAVLEVGLGGRLDATNVVNPLVSVITPISLDHTAILGDTLAQIAREKAGILKQDVAAVTSPQDEQALEVIEQVARERNVPLVEVSSDLEFQTGDVNFQITPLEQNLNFQTCTLSRQPENLDMSLFKMELTINLLGRHQLTNAATALAALFVLGDLGIPIPEAAVRRGLANVEWHGRFEILSREPYLIIDGAHNADSARRLVETLDELFPRARIHFVFGASGDKDIAGMFSELGPKAATFILTQSRNPRAADPARLAALAAKSKIQTFVAPNLESALRDARQHVGRGDVICVTGSLFVVAEARAIWLAESGMPIERDP